MKRRPMSPGDYRLVRAVGRLPARVHTKLLIAFVGTAVLLVAVGALGLRVLAQSDDRVSEPGRSRNEPPRTASSRATPRTFATSSPRTSAGIRLLRGVAG